MADLHNVTIGGRLCTEPELFTTPNGFVIVSFRFANNFRTKNKEGDWIDDVLFMSAKVFGKQAESFAKHHHNKDRCVLVGALREEKWADKATGAQRSKMYLRVDSWHWANPKSTTGPTGGGSPSHGGGSGDTFQPAGNSDFVGVDETPF